jgi:hypothetical protein
MKKNLLIMVGLWLGASSALQAQTFTVTNLNFPVQNADIGAVDIDKDGDIDLLIAGDNSGRFVQLFKNDGSGNYTLATSPFAAVGLASLDFGDVDGDGNLDVIESGFAASPLAKLYKSNALGEFAEVTPAPFQQIAPTSGFADLNNDGYLDVYVFGNHDIGDSRAKIYFNNKTGGFTESAQFNNFKFIDPVVNVVDYDNDKDLDLFVMAYEANSDNRFSKMFRNDNGIFTVQDLGLIPKGSGSAVWGDYDSDGFLDLLLNGDGGINSGEASDFIYRLYRNVGGTFTAATTFPNHRQISVGDGGRFADWDNDGDLDIIITGFNDAENRQATSIFLNNLGIFTPYVANATLPGVSESSIEVTDVDNDNDLDLILTGYSGNNFGGTGSPYNSNVTVLVKNGSLIPNLAPTAPTNLSATGNQAAVTLSWNAATDVTTPANALSYNIFLVDQAGKWFYYPLADTTTGRSKLYRLGNVNLNKSWIIKDLPAGTYRWGVQAVDNSFVGSTFATSGFTINANGTLPIILSNYAVKADGKKSLIEWSTSSEQNNSHFEIERSSNGTNYFKIATVAGKGTTSATTNYSVYDNNPSSGVNYYRLTQFNKDGKSVSFGTKTINFSFDPKALVIAYPNPAESNVGIRLTNFTGNKISVRMTDLMGRVLHTEVIAAGNGQGYYPLHFNSKPAAGQYMLSVDGEGLRQILKLTIK